eukprot:5393466-Pyramimonas_sp.AAC.1
MQARVVGARHDVRLDIGVAVRPQRRSLLPECDSRKPQIFILPVQALERGAGLKGFAFGAWPPNAAVLWFSVLPLSDLQDALVAARAGVASAVAQEPPLDHARAELDRGRRPDPLARRPPPLPQVRRGPAPPATILVRAAAPRVPHVCVVRHLG